MGPEAPAAPQPVPPLRPKPSRPRGRGRRARRVVQLLRPSAAGEAQAETRVDAIESGAAEEGGGGGGGAGAGSGGAGAGAGREGVEWETARSHASSDWAEEHTDKSSDAWGSASTTTLGSARSGAGGGVGIDAQREDGQGELLVRVGGGEVPVDAGVYVRELRWLLARGGGALDEATVLRALRAAAARSVVGKAREDAHQDRDEAS